MIAKLKIVLLMSVVFVFMLTVHNNLYSQEKQDIMKQIRDRLETAPRWLSYRAFIQGNTNICQSASGNKNASEDCWGLLKFLVFVQNLADGNCNNLPPQYSNFGDLCQALRDGQCSSASGYKKSMCEALKSRNTSLMMSVMSDPQYPFYSKDTNNAAEFLINLYFGFKNKSESACDKFTSSSLLRRASCNMLFGNRSFERRLDILAQDIYNAGKSKISCKSEKCPNLCNNINDPQIKLLCEDKSIKSLSDIMQAAWE